MMNVARKSEGNVAFLIDFISIRDVSIKLQIALNISINRDFPPCI